jgi:monoglucosyldiacylglycerol epimerase
MDFNLLSSELFIQLLLGASSAIVAELVRDVYHLAGHYWQPLQSAHTLHHKAYRPDLSMTSLDAYKKAQWFNDVPEAAFMVAITALIASIAQNNGLGLGLWIGSLYALSFLITAIARSQGYLLQTRPSGASIEPTIGGTTSTKATPTFARPFPSSIKHLEPAFPSKEKRLVLQALQVH